MNLHQMEKIYYYRPQRSCGQGNIFTGICLSTEGSVLSPGVVLSPREVYLVLGVYLVPGGVLSPRGCT